jgi:hypothetical protein
MTDPPMAFEIAMRQWFGENAWGIAGSLYSTSTRNKWLRKWVSAVTNEVMALDTDASHKDSILTLLNTFDRNLKGSGSPKWSQILALIKLVNVLFGRLDLSGLPQRTPFYAYEDYFYYRDSGENLPEIGRLKDQPTILMARLEAVEFLENRGLPLWRIAQTLNTSAYAIKKLKSELRATKSQLKDSD